MKKKLLFVVLAVMVAVLFVFVSCGNEETSSSTPAETSAPATSAPETSAPATSAPETSAPETSEPATSEPATSEPATSEPATSEPATSEPATSEPDTTEAVSTRPEPQFSSRNVENKTWDGQTLNVLACRYSSSASGPWGQVEFAPDFWGESMARAQLDREAKITELYGVTVNWVQAMDNQSVVRDLTVAFSSEDTSYEVCYPRSFEVFNLANGQVYDLANRQYIDLNNDYFSEEATRMFTLAGHTLFADGDFNFMNEELSYFLLYNKDMLFNELGIDSIYNEVINGTWTYDKFTSLARAISKDSNGNGEPDDEDTYGFGTKSFNRLYRHFGVYGIYVNEDSEVYEITENANMTRLNKIIDTIIEIRGSSSWARGSWGGSWGANLDVAFDGGRILFYTDVCEKISEMNGAEFSYGVLPFPKLDAEQDRYYTAIPGGAQPIFMCVPKCTKDRDMSDYFIDVLSWTGSDYIMEAYYEHKMTGFDMETAEEDFNVLKNYVWNNLQYDVASMCNGWSSMFESVEADAVKDGVNNFSQAFANRVEDVMDRLDFVNEYWQYYED